MIFIFALIYDSRSVLRATNHEFGYALIDPVDHASSSWDGIIIYHIDLNSHFAVMEDPQDYNSFHNSAHLSET
jgi:hypothetical protein